MPKTKLAFVPPKPKELDGNEIGDNNGENF